jgi:hypothetical protein
MEPWNVLGSVLHFAPGAEGLANTSAAPAAGGFALAMIRAPGGLPGAVQSFLFENQWAWWISLVAVALALRFVGRTRAHRRLVVASWTLLGLTALWIAAAMLIDTPRERLQSAHNALAAAAGRHDLAAIASVLAPDFQSPVLGITRRAAAEAEIRDRLTTYGIKSNTITRFHADLLAPGDAALTQITVLTSTDALGPIQTTWELRWRDVPAEDWRIEQATLTRIGDQPVSPEHIIPR